MWTALAYGWLVSLIFVAIMYWSAGDEPDPGETPLFVPAEWADDAGASFDGAGWVPDGWTA